MQIIQCRSTIKSVTKMAATGRTSLGPLGIDVINILPFLGKDLASKRLSVSMLQFVF